MVKKTISIFVFIAIIFSAGFFESNYIIKSFSFLENELVVVLNMLETDEENIDKPLNIQKLKDLHKAWQERTKILKFFVWHTGIKEVEVGLSRITSYTEENNFTEAYTELNNLSDYCKHYQQDYRFSLQNVI